MDEYRWKSSFLGLGIFPSCYICNTIKKVQKKNTVTVCYTESSKRILLIKKCVTHKKCYVIQG
jgi:hypothetical protein